jgi:uncharacterized cupredoxin-like copper-binding protein
VTRLSVIYVGALVVGLALIGATLATRGTAASGTAIRVTERDFAISLSTRVVRAGRVRVRVTNRGPDAHEFILVRTDGGLPLRADGITVDEDALEKRIVGVLEPAPAGRTRELQVRLTRGRYTILCNMYGHYMGGMHASVAVR